MSNRVAQMRSVAAYGHLAEIALIERLRNADDSYLDTTISSGMRDRCCCGVMFGMHTAMVSSLR